jgi:hypothetical protein
MRVILKRLKITRMSVKITRMSVKITPHDCSNQKQSAKITPKAPKSHPGCQHHTHDVKITQSGIFW